jgi:hypothetical protein
MANSLDAFKVATESLAQEVMRKATHNSVWLNAIPRGSYANNTGLTQTTFTVENSQPVDDTETWDAIALSTGADTNFGACADSYTDTEVGFSERTYSPEKFQLRSQIVCETDLLFQHIPTAFLNAYSDELAKRSKKSWENKLTNEYMKFADKVTIAGSAASAAITNTSTIGELETVALADSLVDLEQGHLDQVAVQLIENGATEGDSNGFINLEANGPVFPLIIGMEASGQLAKNNADLREDFRYGEPNELLKRIGASRVIGSFRHIPSVMPQRFTHDSATGKYVNPAWRTATHEAAIVLNPNVMTAEVVKPQSYGPSFDPKNYAGEWSWITGGDKIGATAVGGDPEGKLGRHYATYMCGFRPVRPEDGVTIIFKRA